MRSIAMFDVMLENCGCAYTMASVSEKSWQVRNTYPVTNEYLRPLADEHVHSM